MLLQGPKILYSALFIQLSNTRQFALDNETASAAYNMNGRQ